MGVNGNPYVAGRHIDRQTYVTQERLTIRQQRQEKRRGRVCLDCPTVLSVYNPQKRCAPCQRNLDPPSVECAYRGCTERVYLRRRKFCSRSCQASEMNLRLHRESA